MNRIGRRQRTLSVGIAVAMLAGAPVIGLASPAWAEDATGPGTTTTVAAPGTTVGTVTDPGTTATVSADGPAPAEPAAAPSAAASPPKGCQGVTPKKPWRLVASRPQPQGSLVRLEWAAVGCTTGYRVDVVGPGVARSLGVAGGSTASAEIADLSPSLAYRITVTSIGTDGDGGVSGVFRLARSAASAETDLAIDFPDRGPTDPVAPSGKGSAPWVNPELTWTAPDGVEVKEYRLRVTGGGSVIERTVAGTATSARLGDEVAAGVTHTVALTPVLADGTDGTVSRLTFGNEQAPRPDQVTGNAPVVQFTPVTGTEAGRVLGYELAFGGQQASKHLFVPQPTGAGADAPWIALDPTFATVEGAARSAPLPRIVVTVRTITALGTSPWTPARTIEYADVATADASYFAGIGQVGRDGETVPRYGFLKVRGSSADLQVTDLVWSQSGRGQQVPVTVSVYGPGGSGTPAFTQDVPVTHLPDVAQDAWRAADLPLPDGWTSIVLRRGGADVATWTNTGTRPCVASVTFADAPTELPDAWRDSWC